MERLKVFGSASSRPVLCERQEGASRGLLVASAHLIASSFFCSTSLTHTPPCPSTFLHCVSTLHHIPVSSAELITNGWSCSRLLFHRCRAAAAAAAAVNGAPLHLSTVRN
ncbi:hypothetical protein E2C01_043123 [Portunus trituberculatus]|uniref:Uncharacterized protein n=1 Tax=Portunus trituberculatus TaxID=210409 RepID=A0A5B7FYI7_PORTR|nr:hypothetical protein [Portunus trituberculatus]